MKPRIFASFLGSLGLLVLLATGCGGGGTTMDTAELTQAFASADAALKGQVDAAAKSLVAGKYLEGATALAALAKDSEKLSEEQKNAMINVVASIQMITSQDPGKSDLALEQAIENMMSGLEGRDAAKVGSHPDAVRPPRTGGE